MRVETKRQKTTMKMEIPEWSASQPGGSSVAAALSAMAMDRNGRIRKSGRRGEIEWLEISQTCFEVKRERERERERVGEEESGRNGRRR